MLGAGVPHGVAQGFLGDSVQRLLNFDRCRRLLPDDGFTRNAVTSPDRLDVRVEPCRQALVLQRVGAELQDQRPHLGLPSVGELHDVVDWLGNSGRVLLKPLAGHPCRELDPVQRLRDGVVQLPRQPLPFLQRNLLSRRGHQLGVCRSRRCLVCQRRQERGFGLVWQLAFSIDGDEHTNDRPLVDERRNRGRLPRERHQGACPAGPSRLALHLPPRVCVNHDSLRLQSFLEDGAGAFAARRPKVFSEPGRHAGCADPGANVVLAIERDPCSQGARAAEGAFGDGLDRRVDRVAHDDARGSLSQGGRLPRLPAPLRHVSGDDQDELLAAEVECTGRVLDLKLGTVRPRSDGCHRLGLAPASVGEDGQGGLSLPFRYELENVQAQHPVERVSKQLTGGRVRIDDSMIAVQDGDPIR